MPIQVKFFASLREEIGIGETHVETKDISRVEDVWNKLASNKAMPENTLMAVNMEYVDASHEVIDGDEVAFFPPVTGG